VVLSDDSLLSRKSSSIFKSLGKSNPCSDGHACKRGRQCAQETLIRAALWS
jgi:hypothetical protein